MRVAGTVYRDEAADLMVAAARRTAEPVQASPNPQPLRRAAPYVQPEARRPLPYAEPIGVNDNPDEPVDIAPIRRRLSLPRLVARILIAPLYLAVAVIAIGIIALFIRGWFGA